MPLGVCPRLPHSPVASATRLTGSKFNIKPESSTIAKNQNTFAKMQREMDKKRKAEDKRSRREERKALADAPPANHRESGSLETDDEAEMTSAESRGDNADG